MSITREQVAELREGDVVEVSGYSVLKNATLRGSLHSGDGQALSLGPLIVRHRDGRPANGWEGGPEHFLTVVSRAPRPLYVNHPRAEPVPGDVVRDTDDVVWLHDRWSTWHSPDSTCEDRYRDTGLEGQLTLLVDGETGQVVP